MTEKRFCSEDGCVGYYTEIIDNEKELDLSLHNPKKNLTIEELVDLLNEQHEQLEMVKLLADHRGKIIAFANSLIQDLGGETEKEMWETFKE